MTVINKKITTKTPIKSTKKLIVTALFASVMMVGCSSKGGIMQSLMLGAASGAITQVNGNSEDVRNAAAIGALLGLLGGVAR